MNMKIQRQVALYLLLAVSTAIATHITINWNAPVADPLSYSIGMQIGANLRVQKININVASFMQGLTDGSSNENPTFTSEKINKDSVAMLAIVINRKDGGGKGRQSVCETNAGYIIPAYGNCDAREIYEKFEY